MSITTTTTPQPESTQTSPPSISPFPTSHLLTLAQTDPTLPLPATTLSPILLNPPFIPLPSTFNTRDLGLLPGSPIRPGFAYRSGGFFTGLSAEGRDVLVHKMGVKRVFDLRSGRERGRVPVVQVDSGGSGLEVEVVSEEPVGEEERLGLAEFVEGDGERGYVRLYMGVLRVYAGSVRRVLEWVRDGEGGGFLFHCTAGRDRTGVVAGLLLSLAGASPETVVLDWMLSRVGTEPAREQLLGLLLKGTMSESVDVPGFRNLCSFRVSCWEAFIRAVDSEYGGFEGYVTKTLGFSDAELARIKANLVLQN